MFVAKSYKSLEQLSEPFEKNGKLYITIRMKSGFSKDVRAYSEKEYLKLYPEEKNNINLTLSKAQPWNKYYKSQKEILGFQKGFVTLVVGANEEEHLGWLMKAKCRLCKLWDWYIPSAEELPTELPAGVELRTLFWQPIGDAEDWLISDQSAILNYVKATKNKKNN